MKILAIETSTLTGSVALLEDDRLVAEITLSVSLQHAERLMPAIGQLFESSRMKLSEIERIACSIGPGSFTGLRIGIAAAQGLAAASGQNVIGVSSLKALSMNAGYFTGTIVPILEARRGEVYLAAYRMTEGVPHEVLEEQAVLRDRIEEILGRQVPPCLILKDSLWAVPRASSIGYLAWKEGLKNQPNPSDPVLPRYLRSPS